VLTTFFAVYLKTNIQELFDKKLDFVKSIIQTSEFIKKREKNNHEWWFFLIVLNALLILAVIVFAFILSFIFGSKIIGSLLLINVVNSSVVALLQFFILTRVAIYFTTSSPIEFEKAFLDSLKKQRN
jgi:hypothetical protein